MPETDPQVPAPVTAPTDVAAQRRWRDVSEHGTRVGIKAVVVLATLFGRGPTRLLGFFLALYYTLRSRVARESGDELRRRYPFADFAAAAAFAAAVAPLADADDHHPDLIVGWGCRSASGRRSTTCCASCRPPWTRCSSCAARPAGSG